MRVLFVHREFPGQFGALAQALASNPAHQVIFATAAQPTNKLGLDVRRFRPRRAPAPSTHHYLRSFESGVLTGQAAFELCHRLRISGFIPDVIYAHCGWGVMLYLKEAFPQSRLVGYFEWFYRPRGSDADFLDQGEMDADRACRIRTLNAPILMGLADCDLGICPTRFQKQQFPAEFQGKLVALHDGVDTDFFAPNQDAPRCIGPVDLRDAARIITYATRGMEPYRGFPQFMRAVDLILKADPGVHVAIAGVDEVFYSRRLANGESYKKLLLQELPTLDHTRVHFLGALPREDYRRLLQISDAHIYMTVPFVLSWSLLEAMACGCLIVGSDTAPVREVITHGENGLLADFHSSVHLADSIRSAIAGSNKMQAATLRSAARSRVLSHYKASELLQKQIEALLGLSHQQSVERTPAYACELGVLQ